MHVTDSILLSPHPAEDMDDLLNATLAKAEGSIATGLHDRRRPGRLDQISPALIPLLREFAQFVDDPDFDADPLTPARGIFRGIFVGLLLSVPLWSLIGLGVWFVRSTHRGRG